MQLFTGNVVTVNPTKTTCYTVPTGYRVITRSIAVRNLSGTVGMSAYVWMNGILVHTFVLTTGGTAGGSDEWDTWSVLTPGQKIEMAVSAAAGVGCIISGSIYFI